MSYPMNVNDVLTVADVTKTYRRGTTEVVALRHVNLRVGRGECVGVVGESGSGKSTLAKISVGLTTPSLGRVVVAGQELGSGSLSRARRRSLARSVQMVFQDPHSSLDPAMTVRESIAEPLRALGWGRRDVRSRIDEILDLVGLAASHADHRPHEMSGGQRQRVGIARALGPRPELLVLDEPVASLDVSIQGQILSLLQDVRAETGVSLVLIAHDLGVVRAIADRTYVMYLGSIMEAGTTERVFDNPLHPYSAALLNSASSERRARMSEQVKARLYSEGHPATAEFHGCVFSARCSRAVEACETSLDHVELPGQEAWCNVPLKARD